MYSLTRTRGNTAASAVTDNFADLHVFLVTCSFVFRDLQRYCLFSYACIQIKGLLMRHYLPNASAALDRLENQFACL